MQYSVGDKVQTRINKIQEKGCFCSFLPSGKNQFGFMPNYLMTKEPQTKLRIIIK